MISLADLKKSKASSLRLAVTEYYREAILTGKLQPGDVIPSSRELAKLLNTSYPNVHYALTPLVKEGLIVRDRKAGTIVRSRKNRIECVVVYVYVTSIDDAGPYQHALNDIVSEHLKKLDIEARLVVDNASHYGLMQIKQWAERGQIQGVIMPREYPEGKINSIMKRLPVPVVFPGARNTVQIDSSNLLELAVDGLARQNCKQVGIISSIEHCDSTGEENRFYRDFKEIVAKSGLQTKPEWIEATATRENYLRTSEMAISFAFEACDRLLNLPERPEGIFIFSDSLIPGIMMAIMKNRLNVPNDIKLVLHLNNEVAIPLFRPCVTIGLSISEIASALINNIIEQYNGRKTKASKVKYEAREFNITNE